MFIELTLYNQNYHQTAQIVDNFLDDNEISAKPYRVIHIMLFAIKLSVLGNPIFKPKQPDLI